MITAKTERGMIVGGISVLMVFLTMSIAIYSLLSLLTAENELMLNQKNRDATTTYYRADAKAVQLISEISSMRTRNGSIDSEINSIPILYNSDEDRVMFNVPIDTFRNLDISILFLDDGSSHYIERYRVISSMDWEEMARRNLTVITEFE